jgi:hypothetical protein
MHVWLELFKFSFFLLGESSREQRPEGGPRPRATGHYQHVASLAPGPAGQLTPDNMDLVGPYGLLSHATDPLTGEPRQSLQPLLSA